MPLFKYVTLDRIDVLVNQEIRYTQLGAFNDPFEMPVFVEKFIDVNEVERHLNSKFSELANAEYKKLPVKVKIKIPFNVFLKKNEQEKLKSVANTKNSFAQFIEHLTPKLQATLQKTDQYFGALSLTETPDNLLMWSHYSGQHTGMVLEFDEFHSIFDERKSPDDYIRHLQQVIYSDTRPILKTFDDFSFSDYMLMKSTEWSYEKECDLSP